MSFGIDRIFNGDFDLPFSSSIRWQECFFQVHPGLGCAFIDLLSIGGYIDRMQILTLLIHRVLSRLGRPFDITRQQGSNPNLVSFGIMKKGGQTLAFRIHALLLFGFLQGNARREKEALRNSIVSGFGSLPIKKAARTYFFRRWWLFDHLGLWFRGLEGKDMA